MYKLITLERRLIMKKKVIAGLVALGVLVASVSTAVIYVNNNNSGTLDENAFRASADIAADTVIYLDDEAIALSDASDTNTALRAEALKAYNNVNEERANAGLGSLKWDSNLESTSSVRSQECSVSFSHTRPNGKAWYTVNSNIQGGENLAFGFDDADSATEAWMNSPTHRDNILYPEFETVAISVYVTDDGTAYWAQEFGY